MEPRKGVPKEKLVDPAKILGIIQKNFIVISRDRTRLIPLTMFPIIMILIFGFTSGNSPKHVPTAVVAYDNSPLAEEVIHALSSNEVFSIAKMVSTEGEAKQMLDDGKIKVIVSIPPNLQQSIDGGGRAVIKLMVDESDSSVAQSVRGAMSAVTASLSREMGVEKIVSFQQSVAAASKKLESSGATSNAETFSLIIARADSASDMLAKADQSLIAMAAGLENSLSYPKSGNFKPFGTNSTTVSENETFLLAAPGYTAIKSQVAALQQGSQYVQAAKADIEQAGAAADSAKATADSSLGYEAQRSNAELPAKAINAFTGYSPGTLIGPVAYEEKPAYGVGRRVIDFLIPAIIALTIFQGAVMGMGRAIAGEKREGSLTRVFLTPTSNVTIILGTLLFYVLFEVFRSSFMMLFATNIFHISVQGSFLAVFAVIVVYAAVCTSIGMFFSSLVKSEQQYLGLSMLISMPTIFLSGAFLPIQAMPQFLQRLAAFLPVTYAADALRGIMIKGLSFTNILHDMAVLLVFLAITLGAVLATFKRDIE